MKCYTPLNITFYYTFESSICNATNLYECYNFKSQMVTTCVLLFIIISLIGPIESSKLFYYAYITPCMFVLCIHKHIRTHTTFMPIKFGSKSIVTNHSKVRKNKFIVYSLYSSEYNVVF